ncbi:pyroglutamyl-peptidase I [soil metagenome]
MTALLTGFEPFDGAAVNSSWEAVQRVPGVVAAVLPVEFGRASAVLDALIEEHRPEVVIAVGLADGRTAITPERVAVNLQDARIPDNAGAQPREQPIDPDGPAAYFSGLPVRAIADAISAAGIPAQVSLSAGAFVCNSVMYRLLASAAVPVAGFIHVPSERDLSVEDIARGLEIAVRVSAGSVAGGL